jgi:hypothetical protein
MEVADELTGWLHSQNRLFSKGKQLRKSRRKYVNQPQPSIGFHFKSLILSVRKMHKKYATHLLAIVGFLFISVAIKSSYAATAQVKTFQCNGQLNFIDIKTNKSQTINPGTFYLGMSINEIEISGATNLIDGRYAIQQREPSGIRFGDGNKPNLYGFFNRFSGDLQVSETAQTNSEEIKMKSWLSETTCVDAKPLF